MITIGSTAPMVSKHYSAMIFDYHDDDGIQLDCTDSKWIPDELWFHIFSFLNYPKQMPIRSVSNMQYMRELLLRIAIVPKPFHCLSIRQLNRLPLEMDETPLPK